MSEPEKQSAENGTEPARENNGQFVVGNPGGPGRPPGTPNRVNALLKDDILQAYEERGGVTWLRSLPDKVFAGLLAKLLPREVAADVRMQATDDRKLEIVLEHIIVPLPNHTAERPEGDAPQLP
jgi:hypothetical protein